MIYMLVDFISFIYIFGIIARRFKLMHACIKEPLEKLIEQTFAGNIRYLLRQCDLHLYHNSFMVESVQKT